MSIYHVRLNAFEGMQEKDISDYLDELNKHKKLNGFIANAVRFVFQNKEDFVKFTKGQIDPNGLTKERAEAYSEINSQISSIKNKVNAIYDMAFKEYMLAQMNKKLGIEDKAENYLLASFILERQLKSIEDALGSPIGLEPYYSGKLESTKERADEILEFILNTYDGMIQELIELTKQPKVIQQVAVAEPQQQIKTEVVQPVTTVETKQIVATEPENKVENKTENTSIADEISDDAVVDFGNADLDGLAKFLNMQI